jgi:hypothetical protein
MWGCRKKTKNFFSFPIQQLKILRFKDSRIQRGHLRPSSPLVCSYLHKNGKDSRRFKDSRGLQNMLMKLLLNIGTLSWLAIILFYQSLVTSQFHICMLTNMPLMRTAAAGCFAVTSCLPTRQLASPTGITQPA